MHRRTHRRLTEVIELLRQNILLARERGDPDSVQALEDTVRYVQSLIEAYKQDEGFIPDPPSQAVRDVLALIRGTEEVRLAPIRKRKKRAKTFLSPQDPGTSSNTGSPPSIPAPPMSPAPRAPRSRKCMWVRRKGDTAAGSDIPPEDLDRLYKAVRDLEELVASRDDDWEP